MLKQLKYVKKAIGNHEYFGEGNGKLKKKLNFQG